MILIFIKCFEYNKKNIVYTQEFYFEIVQEININ